MSLRKRWGQGAVVEVELKIWRRKGAGEEQSEIYP